MSEDEGDGETEVEVEEEDPDADHVPLGGRGVGTVFSLEGGGTGSVPSRKHPTMEVILDSGASRNVLPERVFWRLYEQGRATPFEEGELPTEVFHSEWGELAQPGHHGGVPEWNLARRSGYPVQVQLQRGGSPTVPAVHWPSHGPRERAGVYGQGGSALPPEREVLALSGAGEPAYHFPGASFVPSPAADCVRPAPQEFKPTTAFLRALERLSIPKGWPSLHLLEENLKERSRSCRAVAFHLEQSHFGAVEKKVENACSRETLTPVGLGGSVEGEERGRKEKKEGRKGEEGGKRRNGVLQPLS